MAQEATDVPAVLVERRVAAIQDGSRVVLVVGQDLFDR
jgi:hypothetical protein